MKMRSILLMSISLLLSVNLVAQDYTDWQTSPRLHEVNHDFGSEGAVIVEEKRTHELRREKDDMLLFIYNSKIIKLLTEKGVEMFNKNYIYIPGNAEVLQIKARTIQPDGKIINLPAEKIFEIEEEGKKYKKFAMEGVVKGSEIEYFVAFKKELTTFGIEVFNTSSTPIQHALFTLIVPDHLLFNVKGYNGFNVSKDTVINQKRIITATENNMEVLDDDQYASTTPYQKNVQYKLSYNLDKNKAVRMNTWNELAKTIYQNYNVFTDKELNTIENLYKQLNLAPGLSDEKKIIAVEDYLKTNFNSDENVIGEDGSKIEKILKTKIASRYGLTRLYTGIFQVAGIKTQIVFPSKRDGYPIDETFENYQLIDDLLLYFPTTGNYVDPVDFSQRYPFIQPYYAGTRGLFLKGTTIGDFKTAIASFNDVILLPYEKSYHNHYVQAGFNASMDSVIVHTKQSFLGYPAAAYRPAYQFLSQDKQDEFSKQVVKIIADEDNIKNIKVENSILTDGSKGLPLDISADISSAHLIEKAGNKILLKIGEMIGSQVQMYQEKKRQLPVLIQYPHALDREITFAIPAGYKIKNPDDLNFHITDKTGSGQETMGFVSNYTLKNAAIVVNIHEFYKEISYPLTQFEDFRKVVNAAADFNKVVLVLEKLQ
jgi:hypothetical protein